MLTLPVRLAGKPVTNAPFLAYFSPANLHVVNLELAPNNYRFLSYITVCQGQNNLYHIAWLLT